MKHTEVRGGWQLVGLGCLSYIGVGSRGSLFGIMAGEHTFIFPRARQR